MRNITTVASSIWKIINILSTIQGGDIYIYIYIDNCEEPLSETTPPKTSLHSRNPNGRGHFMQLISSTFVIH